MYLHQTDSHSSASLKTLSPLTSTVPIEPLPDEFGKVQEETFQQLHSDECSVSSQGLDEGPSSPSKPQELDTLSSTPQEDEVNTATNTPGELTIILINRAEMNILNPNESK